MKLPLDQIICHDVAKGLPLPDECIDVVISSPPYWGLRDYGASVQSIFGGDLKCKHKWNIYNTKKSDAAIKQGPHSVIKQSHTEPKEWISGFCVKCNAWKGQLGLEPHPQMYIDHLVDICHEIRRVLKPTGSFYLNLGDTYYSHTSKRSGQFSKKIKKGFDDVYTGSRKIINDGGWLQSKQLLLMPSRVAIALQNDGWVLRNDICWSKRNHMPSSCKDRLATSWEHVFFFVKKAKGYFYDLDAIREPHKADSLMRANYGSNMIPRAWKQEAIPISGGKNIDIDCHPSGKNPGDVIRNGVHHRSGLSNRATYYNQQISLMCDPDGKNPRDVVYSSKYDQVPDSVASESRLIDRVARDRKLKGIPHDLSTSHPSGKNPGDVVKHDRAVGRVGDYNYDDPLHTKEYHPNGKNPGDVLKWNNPTSELVKFFRSKGSGGHYDFGGLGSPDAVHEHPFGKNPGDFWSLTTQPFTGYSEDLEHFAVFPEDLVVRPLLASCPRFVCKSCGKPRERITRTKYDIDHYTQAKKRDPQTTDKFLQISTRKGFVANAIHETVSFSDCGCNAGFDSGVVLDPFAGRGTVGKVAKDLGFHYILFDIKPEYCELARLYIAGQKYKIQKGQKKLKIQ